MGWKGTKVTGNKEGGQVAWGVDGRVDEYHPFTGQARKRPKIGSRETERGINKRCWITVRLRTLKYANWACANLGGCGAAKRRNGRE